MLLRLQTIKNINLSNCTTQNKIFAMPVVHLLDYVAGNIRSLVNAIEKLGFTVEWIKSPDQVASAEVSNELTWIR